jgi:hypothetical protein
MWLELGNVWVNTSHLVRVEFCENDQNSGGKFAATLTTVKPGGSDRTFVYDDDARKLKKVLETHQKEWFDLMEPPVKKKTGRGAVHA